MTTVKRAAGKLLDHIQNCPIIGHSVSFVDNSLKCICSPRTAFEVGNSNFVRDIVRHFESENHTSTCGWRLDKDYKEPNGLKTFLYHSRQIGDFYKPPSPEPIPEVEMQEDVTLSETEILEDSQTDTPAVQIDSQRDQDSLGTQTERTYYYDKGTCMDAPVRGTCCSARDIEELLCPRFKQDLTSFYRSMKFELKPGFDLEDVYQYYNQHPIAKMFTENGFSRDLPQSHHAKCVKDYVVGKALKHQIVSASEWSGDLGGPRLKTVQRGCRSDIHMLPYLDEESMKKHFEHFIDNVLINVLKISRCDLGKIPIQASYDATATIGRLYTRKGEGLEDGTRIIYGVSCPRPTKKTLIDTEERDDGVRLTEDRDTLRIHGMEHVMDLVEEGLISRASLYMTVILLPLIPDARPYCVALYAVSKGSKTSTLELAQNTVLHVAKTVGLNIVTLPGDGDSTLRSLQWSRYSFDRGWSMLRAPLRVPFTLYFDSNGELFRFAMQDMLHNIKKGRNSVKLLETHCMALGPLDPGNEKKNLIRWDLVYDLFSEHPEVMRYSSLGALNVTDKQDPSLVTDLTRLHAVFSHYGYEATGMYFKALHFLCEAFLDKSLNPYQRVYKAWWCKTFFVVWDSNKDDKEEFMTREAYKDIVCGCDGLVLYLEMLRKKFPDAVVTTYYLGSDQNEQLYAFLRVSFVQGRSRNLDAVRMAYGIERRNLYSSLCIPSDSSSIAHTRGRSVLRPEVKVVDDPQGGFHYSIDPPAPEGKVWKGSDINASTMIKVMNDASRDCIGEGKQRKFGVFLKEKLDVRPNSDHSDSDVEEDSSDEEEVDEEPVLIQCPEAEDEDTPLSIVTKKYGTLHFKAAETLLLNGGKSSISMKSRKSQFTADVFGIASDIRLYTQNFCGCSDALQRGDFKTLPVVVRGNAEEELVSGEVRFLSYQRCPMKFYCKLHSLINGVPNIWLHDRHREKYVRCRYE